MQPKAGPGKEKIGLEAAENRRQDVRHEFRFAGIAFFPHCLALRPGERDDAMTRRTDAKLMYLVGGSLLNAGREASSKNLLLSVQALDPTNQWLPGVYGFSLFPSFSSSFPATGHQAEEKMKGKEEKKPQARS